MKFLKVLPLLFLAALGLGQYTGPDHGNTTPGYGPDGGVHPISDSLAYYDFDDPTDLGREARGKTSLDLTPVNTPTATGGATRYAADFDVNDDSYAKLTTHTIGHGDGVSWGFACWSRPKTDGTMVVMGQADDLLDDGEWDAYRNQTTGYFTVRARDSVGVKSDVLSVEQAVGERAFQHGRYNATTNELEAGMNGSWTGTPTSLDTDPVNLTIPFYVGSNIGDAGATYMGTIGSCVYYRSTSGGEVLTDAITTSLHNSTKGKTCGELTAAEQVNLVSCWDMDDDPAHTLYNDTVGRDRVEMKVAGGAWSGTAVSSSQINVTDGTSIGFTEQADYYTFFGLSSNPIYLTYSDIDYAIYAVSTTNAVQAWQNGSVDNASCTTSDNDDTLEVRVVGTSVKVFKNGVEACTFSNEITPGDYYVKVNLHTPGSYVDDITINGDPAVMVPFHTGSSSTAGVGDNILLGQNTPTQSNALVDQPASGMSAHLTDAGSEYFSKAADTDFALPEFSACMWVNPRSFTANSDIFRRYAAAAGYIMQISTGASVVLYIYDGTASCAASTAPSLTVANTWSYVCGTFDGTVATAWIDGVPDSTPDTCATALSNPASTTLLVGGNGDEELDIDALAVWDHVITEAEILKMYNDSKGRYLK